MSKIENWSKTDNEVLAGYSTYHDVWSHDDLKQEVVITHEEADGKGADFYSVDVVSQIPSGDNLFDYERKFGDTKDEARDMARGLMERNPEGITTKGGIEPDQLAGDSPHVYRVRWHESHPAGGDVREIARYRAFSIDDVIDAVEADHIDDDANVYEDGGYVGSDEERVNLRVETEIDPVDEGIVSEEEFEMMDREEKERMKFQDANVEIVRDDDATYPMNLVTGGTAGADLTE